MGDRGHWWPPLIMAAAILVIVAIVIGAFNLPPTEVEGNTSDVLEIQESHIEINEELSWLERL